MPDLITKLFGKPWRTPPHSPFKIQELPLELLLAVFDHLSVRDLYHFSAITPPNALSNHAKSALLRRVFYKECHTKISWCCNSCAMGMDRKQDFALQDQMTMLLFPKAPNFSTYIHPKIPVDTEYASVSRWHKRTKHQVTIVLDRGRPVQLSFNRLLKMKTFGDSRNLEAKMTFVAYYFEKVKRAEKEKGMLGYVRSRVRGLFEYGLWEWSSVYQYQS